MNAIDKALDAIKGLETEGQRAWFFANNPEYSSTAPTEDTPATHRAKAETFIAAQKPAVQRALRKYGEHTDSGYRVTLPVKGNFKGGYDYHNVSNGELTSLGKLGDRLSLSTVSPGGARYYLDHSPKTKEYLTPQPVGVFSRVKDGLTVYKGTDGLRYLFIVTSNSYKDRDNETITTKALQAYVDGAWSVEGKCLPRNELLFWHDGEPIGDIVWTDMEGPFLLEVAKERPDKSIQLTTKGTIWQTTIKSVWDAFEMTAHRGGASHGFRYPDGALDNGVFKRIAKFETSWLPLDAASNPLTFSGVIDDMNKDKFLEDLLKTPGLADKFRKGIRSVKQGLDERGLEHKAADDTALKGKLQDAKDVLDKAFAKLGDTVPDGFSEAVLHQLITAMSADGMAEDDPNEPADASGGPAYDSAGATAKQTKLIDRLITSQEQIAEDNVATKEAVTQTMEALKSIATALQPLSALPETVKALGGRIAAIEPLVARIDKIEKRLEGAPRRAATDPATVVDDKELTDKAKKQAEQYEDLFPGSGIKLKPTSTNGKG